MHDDFADLARLAPTRPGQSTEQLTAELERLRAAVDERLARLADDPQQSPLIWCVDETHAALDTPIDPALRARVADILITQGRTVTLVPGRHS